MLKAHGKEQHDRHPHGDGLAADGCGDHRADHAHRDHPVAQHAADEDREPAANAVGRVADGAALADMGDELADLVSGGLGLVVEVLGLFASLAAWC